MAFHSGYACVIMQQHGYKRPRHSDGAVNTQTDFHIINIDKWLNLNKISILNLDIDKCVLCACLRLKQIYHDEDNKTQIDLTWLMYLLLGRN